MKNSSPDQQRVPPPKNSPRALRYEDVCRWCKKETLIVDHEVYDDFMLTGPDSEILVIEFGDVCVECWDSIKQQWHEKGDLTPPTADEGIPDA